METHSTKQVRVLCAHVFEHMGHPVTIHGWVHSIRHLGQLAFMHVRDRSGIIQCVLEGSSPKHRLAWNRSSP